MIPDLATLHAWGYHLIPWRKRHTVSDNSMPLVANTLTQRINPTTFARLHPLSDWACVPTFAVVLDLEMKKGLDGVADLLAMGEIPTCPTTRTKSGGFHHWFRQPDQPITGGWHLAPGVEVKAINGSVHLPPSTGYEWLRPLTAAEELPKLPDWLLAKLATRPTKTSQPTPDRILDGERRHRLCSIAGKIRTAINATEPELFAILCAVRDGRCDHPESFTDEEVQGIARDFARKSADAHASASPQPTTTGLDRFLSDIKSRPRVAGRFDY